MSRGVKPGLESRRSRSLHLVFARFWKKGAKACLGRTATMWPSSSQTRRASDFLCRRFHSGSRSPSLSVGPDARRRNGDGARSEWKCEPQAGGTRTSDGGHDIVELVEPQPAAEQKEADIRSVRRNLAVLASERPYPQAFRRMPASRSSIHESCAAFVSVVSRDLTFERTSQRCGVSGCNGNTIEACITRLDHQFITF